MVNFLDVAESIVTEKSGSLKCVSKFKESPPPPYQLDAPPTYSSVSIPHLA